MRVRKGSARRKANKRWFQAAEGYVMGRRKLLRTVKEAVVRSRAYAFRDRRLKKRDFRSLWIVRVSAACEAAGISYSVFMHGLKDAGVTLNRKMLSELAIHEPATFAELVKIAQSAA